MGVDVRTVQRLCADEIGEDRRAGPHTPPARKLNDDERAKVHEVVNSPEFRDLSPKQIVPALADRGEYIASESTFYRLLREEDQVQPRESSRPPAAKPRELAATGPNQVWSWDITYMATTIRGRFFFLYLMMDVWSRKIVGWEVHDREDQNLAAALLDRATATERVPPDQLTMHADNGGAMKGCMMVAKMQELGVAASFSRPHVSDDNPYSEALFRTLKYRPEYPNQPFDTLAEARAWVAAFVDWYNLEHFHSGIRYVTPTARHSRAERDILANRHEVYEAARARNPNRWTGPTRNWTPIETVVLNAAA